MPLDNVSKLEARVGNCYQIWCEINADDKYATTVAYCSYIGTQTHTHTHSQYIGAHEQRDLCTAKVNNVAEQKQPRRVQYTFSVHTYLNETQAKGPLDDRKSIALSCLVKGSAWLLWLMGRLRRYLQRCCIDSSSRRFSILYPSQQINANKFTSSTEPCSRCPFRHNTLSLRLHLCNQMTSDSST